MYVTSAVPMRLRPRWRRASYPRATATTMGELHLNQPSLPSGEPAEPQPTRGVRPPKLYRIGELVAYCGLSRQTVHNYTTMGLLREVRWSRGGHRLYDESAFERLDEIGRMKARGMRLEAIREHFARIDGTG